MKTLLLATHNPAKVFELKTGLKDFAKKGTRILSLKDLKIDKDLEETGKTFKENAFLKAKFFGDLTRLPTVGDDGGLIIPALNNEPGVKSRRWLGYEASDEDLINHTLSHLRGANRSNRTAYLQVCLCFYDPKTSYPEFISGSKKMLKQVQHDICIYSQEKIKGYIADKPSNKRLLGYPFRSLFIVEKFNKYYDELTEKEHNKINHRLIALTKLLRKIDILIPNNY